MLGIAESVMKLWIGQASRGWITSYYYHYPLLGVSVFFLRALSEQKLKALIETTPLGSSIKQHSFCKFEISFRAYIQQGSRK